jgi:OOP family OmpA-OmpF porin
MCLALSIWTVDAIERFSRLGVRRELHEKGYTWVEVQGDGLRLILSGTAPAETHRLRALSLAGEVVDSTRLVDAIEVVDTAGIAAPEFKIEILRNDDGISLIGLAPAAMDRDAFLTGIDSLAAGDLVTDMLETADYEVPPDWQATVDFALEALTSLPRSKVSVTSGHVAITAITDSAAQKRDLEARLRRDAHPPLRLTLDISAPRPVITPFTVRFLIDEDGARFDACSAESERARDRILAAGKAAGISGAPGCTIGLGVPTPAWSGAVVQGIEAVARLGAGSITFSDTDVALIAGPGVSGVDFDTAVGELESNLPDAFALKASRPAVDDPTTQGAAEFVARVDAEGIVTLSGRVRDELSREAVESFAASRFGSQSVRTAMRIDETVPEGWSQRVLVALEVLGELAEGQVTVRAGDLAISGTAGLREASDTVSRILASKLGGNGRYDIAIRYVEALDPVAALPSGADCVDGANAVLAEQKIVFEPGSAIIAPEARETLDRLAEILKDCADHPIEVGGHTDSQGREEMNLALSEQRARSVIVALQSRRILTGNLVAQGYGETVPLMANDTEQNRDTNRRIEFRLIEAPVDTGGTEDAVPVVVRTPDGDTPRPRKRPEGLGGN